MMFLALIFFVSGSFADDPPQLSLEELLRIVVTVASKTEEPFTRAPSSTTVFSRAEIRNLGITHFEELMNFVPGFQSTIEARLGPGYYSYASRGRRSGDVSADILVLIDGRRINEHHTGGATLLTRLMALDHVRQVEFIRGPGSALYGSNAFMGVVNIITDTSEQEINLRFGANEYKDFSAMFVHQDDRWNMSAFVRGFADEGYDYGEITDLVGTTDTVSDPREGLDFYGTLEIGRLTTRLGYSARDFSDYIQFGRIADGINREKNEQTFASLTFRALTRDDLHLNLTASYTESRWDALARFFPAGHQLFPGFVFEQPSLVGPYMTHLDTTFGADLSWEANDRNTLTAGVTLIKTEDSDSAQIASHDPRTRAYNGGLEFYRGDGSFVANNPRRIVGVYVQDRFEIREDLLLTAGIRFDDYDDVGNSTNPRTALVYDTPWGGTTRLMYGQAFRAPSFSELYNQNNPSLVGNPELKPEKIETLELAYSQEWRLIWGALTWFDNDISDVLTTQIRDNVVIGINEGTEITRGFELEMTVRFSEQLLLKGTFTRVTDGAGDYTSASYGSMILNYTYDSWNLNLNGIYRAAAEALPDQGDYGVLHSRFSYDAGVWELQLTVNNLLDEDYLTPSEVFLQGSPNRGRTVWLGLSWR